MQNHVGKMVAIHIDETQRHRDQVIIAAIELRPDVDARFGSVSSGKLNHFDTPIQI